MPASPILRALPPLRLAGVSFYGNPFLPAEGSGRDHIELLWSRYRRTAAVLPGFASLPVGADLGYELHVYGYETASEGLLEVFAGQAVAGSAVIPHELCLKALGRALYAVLDLRGEDAAADWRGWASREWLPRAGYEAVGTHDLLLLRLHPSGEREPEEAWLPVRERR